MAKIYLAADHAGFQLKEQVKTHLRERDLMVEDQGAYTLEPEDDYTDYVKIVAKMIQGDPESRGLIFGGSGQGEAICANRFKGVRAAVYYGGNPDVVELSRVHNDANILSLGARFITPGEVVEMVDLWLKIPFSGDARHIRRINEIDNIDNVGGILEY
ncbi:MAG: RpiB/LacA/LacB family sugar-phosphate isomerase [Candidatus Paceibacterota bacterium]|jgi:ribose 5-phosphate isomerase B